MRPTTHTHNAYSRTDTETSARRSRARGRPFRIVPISSQCQSMRDHMRILSTVDGVWVTQDFSRVVQWCDLFDDLCAPDAPHARLHFGRLVDSSRRRRSHRARASLLHCDAELDASGRLVVPAVVEATERAHHSSTHVSPCIPVRPKAPHPVACNEAALRKPQRPTPRKRSPIRVRCAYSTTS
jgi:hypothetical protein